MLMVVARPATRWAARPGRRAIDSAMLESGSLPMSSAEIASTIEVDSCLILMAFSIPRRMPVTTTLSICFASAFFSSASRARRWAGVSLALLASALLPSAGVCACTPVASINTAEANAMLSTLRLNFTIAPSHLVDVSESLFDMRLPQARFSLSTCNAEGNVELK